MNNHHNSVKYNLENDQIQDIGKAMYDAWHPSPAERAAIAIRKLGYNAYDFWCFQKTATASVMDTYWLNATYNELKNSELKDNEK